MLGEHALVVTGDADGVDGEGRVRADGEPARDVAAFDRVRHEHGVGAHERGRRGEGVDDRHGQRAVRAAEVGREHRRGTALTGGRGKRGLRVAGGHDERDGRADLRGRAEQSGRRRGELARRRDIEDDENRVCSEIHHDLPLTPDGSR